ncbi:MAG: hypothetical protein ACXWCM_08185 [Acidimicrobiales bacterium]
MTIRRGEPWGEPATLPADGVIVRSDAEARAIVTEARRTGRPVPALGLLGGDLCRTLGGRGDEERLRSTEAMSFPCDLGVAELDGERHWFVAHAIARRSWWRGRVVAAMNAQWLGAWDLGPRSHPDDGLLDITDGTLPTGERLEARRRLPTGTHLPHPALAVTRTASAELELDPPLDLWLDSQKVGRGRHLVLTIEPDALRIVV